MLSVFTMFLLDSLLWLHWKTKNIDDSQVKDKSKNFSFNEIASLDFFLVYCISGLLVYCFYGERQDVVVYKSH